MKMSLKCRKAQKCLKWRRNCLQNKRHEYFNLFTLKNLKRMLVGNKKIQFSFYLKDSCLHVRSICKINKWELWRAVIDFNGAFDFAFGHVLIETTYIPFPGVSARRYRRSDCKWTTKCTYRGETPDRRQKPSGIAHVCRRTQVCTNNWSHNAQKSTVHV